MQSLIKTSLKSSYFLSIIFIKNYGGKKTIYDCNAYKLTILKLNINKL